MPDEIRDRQFVFETHVVCEGTLEYGQVKALLERPERFIVVEDEREGRILEEFRGFDARRKDFALEIITSLPKRSK